MRNPFLILALIGLTTFSFAQISNPKTLDLVEDEDFKKAEKEVLVCANYLLSNPVNKETDKRMDYFKFLFKWMEGTPYHTFSIGEKAMEITEGKSEHMILYFTAMTKVVLESESEEIDPDGLQNKALEFLFAYCNEPDNKLKPTKKMKKASKGI